MMKFVTVLAMLASIAAGAPAQELPDEIARPYVAYTEAMEAADYDAAIQAAQQAWRAAQRLDFDPETTATLADNYAQLAMALGEYENAGDAYREVAETLTELDAQAFIVAETWVLAARAALTAGDHRDALRWADTAGDLIENADGVEPRARAELTFSSRAIQSNALWLQGRVQPAAARAREAMAAAEGYDLTENASYGLMTFILGAAAAMDKDYSEAAFRLTQAHVYLPGQRGYLREWANYARRQLDDAARIDLLNRIAAAQLLEEDLPPVPDETDGPWSEDSDSAGRRVDASVLRRRPPDYPNNALRAGFDGVALVQFSVDENGRARDVEVIISIPFSDFGEAASEAVRGWRYTPATLDGVPVVREGVVTQFEFMIEE